MPVESGQVIAERYRLVRPIGKGAQAAVWIADHLALGSQVAVKLMDPELVEQGDARERFRREATAAAQLRSAHVVHILDHGIDNGQPFMVMELLDGEDLFQRLERKGRLTLVEASVIVTQIARALARAHAAGIVHRDLKPENVYLVPNEDEEVAKVLDFGVAKFLEAGAAQRRTSAGTLLGTPHYMSPEQVRGVGDIDHRSDLWSLGVIAFQLTVGDLPFESEGVGDLLIKITMEKIPIPSQAYAALPKSFDEWFAKACHRDPDLRFQTGRELANALARVAGLIPPADSLRGVVVPVKGRSEPPGFDVDFDEVPSIPPPAPPPPAAPPPEAPLPKVAAPPAIAKAAPLEIAKTASAVAAAPTEVKAEDVDDEWPEEPPAPSIPPPPVAATPPRAAVVVASAKPAAPARPGGAPARPAAPARPPAKSIAATTPAARTETPPPPPARAPSDSAEPARAAATAVAVSPAFVASVAAAAETAGETAGETEPTTTSAETSARAIDPAPASPAAPELAIARAAPAPRVETAAAAPPPPPRPSATRTSSPPISARSSDPPRSKNQLSSTISGASGDVIPPPELDGSRKKRAVLWVAAIALLGACAVAVAVVQSQGTSQPAPGNASPQAPTAEPSPTVTTPPAPAATPSTSASAASSAGAAVDPGTSKRPIKGGSTPPPTVPRNGGQRKPAPAKDGEIVIDVPLPDREVPVPPSP